MKKKYALIAVIIIAAAAASAFFLLGSPGKYDDFAKCLSGKGVKMYGAFWCPHCNAQKDEFGSSWQYMTYVECSTPDGKGQTLFCQQQNITGYPTWEFGDGSRVASEMTFQELSQRTNCTI